MDQYDRHAADTQRIINEKFKQGNVKNLYIPEILEGIDEIESFDDRVKALRANSDRSLNTILQVTFKEERPRLTAQDIEAIKYKPAYSGDDFSISPSTLYDVSRRVYIFYRTDITVAQMSKIAMEILSNLHPIEAEVFKGIFKGKMPYKNITKELVRAAFPDLFAGELTEEEKKEKEEKHAEALRQAKILVDAEELAKAKKLLQTEEAKVKTEPEKDTEEKSKPEPKSTQKPAPKKAVKGDK